VGKPTPKVWKQQGLRYSSLGTSVPVHGATCKVGILSGTEYQTGIMYVLKELQGGEKPKVKRATKAAKAKVQRNTSCASPRPGQTFNRRA
jgi:hypothetical protein